MLKKEELYRYIPLLVFALIVVVMGFVVPRFLSLRNIVNILNQSAALGLMAIGITFAMVTGGIDLSGPSVMALGGILGAMWMRQGGSPLLGSAIMVAFSTLLGAFNGFAVAYLKMVPFVVTLSMMYVATGASIWLTREVSISNLPPRFIATLTARILEIPVPVFLFFGVALVVFGLIRQSRYGRWLYATGSNVTVAKLLGVPTERMVFTAYLFSGFFAGLAAVVTTARLMSASSKMGGEGVILNVVGAAVVGGVSVHGAEGSVLGAAIGALFITILENMMNMMQVSYYLSLVAKGALVVAVVAFDYWRKRTFQERG
ncbi:MAG: ABC transporter permease [Atribacterota bacterium]